MPWCLLLNGYPGLIPRPDSIIDLSLLTNEVAVIPYFTGRTKSWSDAYISQDKNVYKANRNTRWTSVCLKWILHARIMCCLSHSLQGLQLCYTVVRAQFPKSKSHAKNTTSLDVWNNRSDKKRTNAACFRWRSIGLNQWFSNFSARWTPINVYNFL